VVLGCSLASSMPFSESLQLAWWDAFTGLVRTSALRTFLGLSKATHLLWLALPLLTRQLLIKLHFVCMELCCRYCARIFRPGQPSCVWRHVTSLCFRKDVARAGRSLCGFLTCNVLLPSLRRTNSTGSRGSMRPRGAGSSRFWRTRRSARTRRAGSRGCFTVRMPATLRPGWSWGVRSPLRCRSPSRYNLHGGTLLRA